MSVRFNFPSIPGFCIPLLSPFWVSASLNHQKGDDQFYEYSRSWVFEKTSFERPPPVLPSGSESYRNEASGGDRDGTFKVDIS